VRVLRKPAYHFKRIGLEAAPLSQSLLSALAEAGLPVLCVETRQAVLKARIDKTPRRCAQRSTDECILARRRDGGRSVARMNVSLHVAG
jgi:hypothetical protein